MPNGSTTRFTAFADEEISFLKSEYRSGFLVKIHLKDFC